MGLKSGSRDAGLDEEEETDDRSVDEASLQSEDPGRTESDPDKSDPRSADVDVEPGRSTDSDLDSARDTEGTSQRPAMSSIPYKLRRDKVNEGREQVPYFLREEIIEAEDDLQDRLEDMLGESVYKSDYREAAMVVAQRNPELVAEVLREWGYDLEA